MNEPDIDQMARDIVNRVFEQIHQSGPWEKYFAWKPVKIHNKRVWLKTVYRRKAAIIMRPDGIKIPSKFNGDYWEYGDLFDVLKNA